MKVTVEETTGKLYGKLWPEYDDQQYLDSVALFEKRWTMNREPPDFFRGKDCLDVGCGGGRFSIAMASMGARSVVGVDVSESGLADAQRRVEGLRISNVEFRTASALDLPFPSGSFDFVCCSGVLHHTLGVERGLAEIHRVLRPDGSVYLLLYGAGGLFWPSNYLTRSLAALLGQEEVERGMVEAGYNAARRRSVLDDLFVPVLETYSEEKVRAMLQAAGFSRTRTWTQGRLDHESSLQDMLKEMESRWTLWQRLTQTCESSSQVYVAQQGARLYEWAISTVQYLLAQYQSGHLSETQVRQAVIGSGHTRLIATRD